MVDGKPSSLWLRCDSDYDDGQMDSESFSAVVKEARVSVVTLVAI